MRRKWFFIIVLFISYFGFSQNIELKGTVKDSLQNPLNFANVIAKPATTGKNMQFATTDNEGYYRLLFAKGDTVNISITYLGYQSINWQFIANTDTVKNFIMQSSSEQLDEIVIEMPIVVKGDTTIYKTEKFTTGEERKLKNVLKKLPGVEVDKDGGVTVQGKTVTKMLVDGKKFFGGNSKLAVENIPADAVGNIEVIDNYNEVAFLKSLTDSNELAMNIKLRENKKRFVFGDVEAGWGKDDYYKTHANLFYYAPKTNVNFIGNINNIAEKTFTFKDYLSFQGGVNAVFSGNFDFGGGDFTQFLNNRDVLRSEQRFGALNITQTTSSKLDVSGYLIANHTQESNLAETINTFPTFNETRENSLESDNLSIIGKFNLEYKASKREQWSLTTQLKKTDREIENLIVSTIANNANSIETSNNLDLYEFNPTIEWYKRYSDKHTVSAIINYNFSNDQRRSIWQSQDPILQGLIPVDENQSLLRLLQVRDFKKQNVNFIIKYFWEINNSNHIYTTLGNTYNHQFFGTDDSQELDNGSVNSFSNSGFGNNLNFGLNDFFLGLHYKYRVGILTAKQGIYLRNYAWSLDQENSLKRNKWFLLPDFLVKLEFNKSKKLEFSYRMQTSFSDADKLATNFYLRSFNSVFRGNEDLENNLYHTARLYYSRFSLFRGLMMNLNANYSKQVRGVRNIVAFDGVNQFLTNNMFDNPSESFSLRGRISKRIKKLKYNLELSTSFSEFVQPVNDELIKNQNNNYSYSFGFETLFEKFPVIELGFKRSLGEFTSSNSTSNFRTNEPFVTINYEFLNGFNFSFDYSRFDFKNKALNQENKFDVSNISLEYRKEDSAWTYKIFSNNLFNTGFKRNSSFSQFLISDSKTFILPRVILVGLVYNL